MDLMIQNILKIPKCIENNNKLKSLRLMLLELQDK